MIVTKKWLNDFVKIDDLSAQEISDAFTFCGFEMETYKDLSEKLKFVAHSLICLNEYNFIIGTFS